GGERDVAARGHHVELFERGPRLRLALAIEHPEAESLERPGGALGVALVFELGGAAAQVTVVRIHAAERPHERASRRGRCRIEGLLERGRRLTFVARAPQRE